MSRFPRKGDKGGTISNLKEEARELRQELVSLKMKIDARGQIVIKKPKGKK